MEGKTKNLFLFILVLFVTNLLFADLTDGLIGYYPFNGNANDESGNGNDLTVHGATLTYDRLGNENASFNFDGINDYLERFYDPDFTPGNDNWTVSAWVKADSSGRIVSWYRCGADPGCNSTDSALYGLSINNGNNAAWSVRDDIANDITLQSEIQINKWYLITGIFENDNDIITLYIDGSLNTTDYSIMTSLTDGGTNIPFEIGRVYRTGWGEPGEYFFGKIDDIRVYNRALSDDEIQEIYHQGNWMNSPENMTIFIYNNLVELNWDSVIGATSYNVYSSEDPYGTFTLEPTGTGIMETDWSEDISENVKYYQVKAIN